MAKVINWLNEHLEEYILCNLLAVISIVMILQVIMRYVFNASLTWAEELCRYAFIPIMLGTVGDKHGLQAGFLVVGFMGFLAIMLTIYYYLSQDMSSKSLIEGGKC